jgi:hypothetical protein
MRERATPMPTFATARPEERAASVERTRPSGLPWPLLSIWALLTALGSVVVYQRAQIEEAPMPDAAASRWVLASLQSARTGEPLPPAPAAAASYRAAGPVIAFAWSQGQPRARHVGSADLVASVRDAATAFAADPALRALPRGVRDPVRFTVAVVRGEGPMARSPLLSQLGVVPLLEGVMADVGGRRAYITPDEMRAAQLFDLVPTPIPDLRFGVDLGEIERRLGRELGIGREQLVRTGSLSRIRVGTIAAQDYPAAVPPGMHPSAAALEQAAREGALFLLRHQLSDGRYTYLYRAGTGDSSAQDDYNLPRHAGTTYFLAQAARVLDMPEARQGALRALRWLRREALVRCGSIDRLCIRRGQSADMGSSALASLAAAELLRGGEDAGVRTLLIGLNAFIRSMQRPDGELMHVYDLEADKPIDVQRMYFSGEAADALLSSRAVLGDARDVEAARGVMRHLTGAGWSFFGSRYFYGEEHWTCQAVARAAEGADAGDEVSRAGIEFCRRWLGFQRALQYRPGQAPWPVEGAIGVGPLIVPRLTSTASRLEAAAMLYPVLRAHGYPVGELRSQIEASLRLMLRTRWAPGPTHLLFEPDAALGGVPQSMLSLDVRNDYVQHACSGMLHWVEVLRQEQSE